MYFECMVGGDVDIVEEVEVYWVCFFGMVIGWVNGIEGVFVFVVYYQIDCYVIGIGCM